MNDEHLLAFLHYGFLPLAPDDLEARPWCRPVAPRSAATATVEHAAAAFRTACSRLLEQSGTGTQQVVPLSGGLDSRLILATLLELGARERITTVTFGTPHTLDFELGRVVARRLGVRHESIALPEQDIDSADVAATLATGGRWVPVHEALYNRMIPQRFGHDAVYWTGNLANTLNGAWSEPRGESWEAARRRFATGRRFARTMALTPKGYDPTSILPKEPVLGGTRLEPFEQLYVALVNPSRNDPILLANGYDYSAPFQTPEWCTFALSLPPEARAGQRLYRHMALAMAPDAFALPAKTTDGVPIGAPAWRRRLSRTRLKLHNRFRRHVPWIPWAPNPSVNYVDLDHELRRPTALARLVLPALERLRTRDATPWLDPIALWDVHRRGRRNLGDALMALYSLAVNLEADAARPDVRS